MVFILSGAPGCRDDTPAHRPHLLLIVIDNLRSDHLGVYGYPRPTSRNIDRLGADGVIFTRAVAPSSWTKPSVGSLFTSRHPSEHGAVSFERHLNPDVPTLAGLLRDAGYRTLGVSGNFVHLSQLSGFDRGFDVWKSFRIRIEEGARPSFWQNEVDGERRFYREPRAWEINHEILRRLPPPDEAPLFLYVHYMEPHAPYEPPERMRKTFATDPSAHHERGPVVSTDALMDLVSRGQTVGASERQWLIDLYDAEIAAVDHHVGRLLHALERRGFAERLVTVIVSDHGEEFGEHGGWFHGLNLHAESQRVPLLIRDARNPGGGQRRDEPVDLLDVPTTLLTLADVDPPPGMRGRALLTADGTPPRDLVAELHHDPPFETRAAPREQHLALTRWPWKVIVNRQRDPMLYRLDRDPGESDPLGPGEDDLPDDLLGDTAELERRLREAMRDGDGTPLVPGEIEGLRALGYVD